MHIIGFQQNPTKILFPRHQLIDFFLGGDKIIQRAKMKSSVHGDYALVNAEARCSA